MIEKNSLNDFISIYKNGFQLKLINSESSACLADDRIFFSCYLNIVDLAFV